MPVNYSCPICTLPLQHEDNRLCCDKNHSFDMAKEGYYNLLPVQHKKSKEPGDNKTMVMARRNFLNRGHYNFLRDALCHQINNLPDDLRLLDLGCGEGFYSHKFAEQSNVNVAYGLDISKPAIKYASKRFKNCQFSVASSSNTPFSNGFFDAVVSVFSPLFTDELQRLVKPRGKLLVASPGDNHLSELKALIYRDVRTHQPVETPVGFELDDHSKHTQVVSLDQAAITELIHMTPFAWKFRPEHWQLLKTHMLFDITLSFYVSVFSRIDTN